MCDSFWWIAKGLSHTYVSLFSQTPPLSRMLHNMERISCAIKQCPCWLSILNVAECTCPSQTPYLFLPLTGNLKFIIWVVSLFCKWAHLYHFCLVSTYKWCHMVVLLWLTDFTQYDTHVAAHGIISSFQWRRNIPLYICNTSSLFIPLSMDI